MHYGPDTQGPCTGVGRDSVHRVGPLALWAKCVAVLVLVQTAQGCSV